MVLFGSGTVVFNVLFGLSHDEPELRFGGHEKPKAFSSLETATDEFVQVLCCMLVEEPICILKVLKVLCFKKKQLCLFSPTSHELFVRPGSWLMRHSRFHQVKT